MKSFKLIFFLIFFFLCFFKNVYSNENIAILDIDSLLEKTNSGKKIISQLNLINEENLSGENVKIITNYNLPLSDTYYFKDGFFNFKNENFIAKNPKIKLHSTLFGNKENNPRLYGASSSSKNGITTIKKGVFTSCVILVKKLDFISLEIVSLLFILANLILLK